MSIVIKLHSQLLVVVSSIIACHRSIFLFWSVFFIGIILVVVMLTKYIKMRLTTLTIFLNFSYDMHCFYFMMCSIALFIYVLFNVYFIFKGSKDRISFIWGYFRLIWIFHYYILFSRRFSFIFLRYFLFWGFLQLMYDWMDIIFLEWIYSIFTILQVENRISCTTLGLSSVSVIDTRTF